VAEPGIESDRIIIGQSAAFTGTPAAEVKQATAGAQLYFDTINKAGGVHGRKIVLESMDDGFEPKRTLENTRVLVLEKKVFALFLYRGTPTVEAVLPLVNEARVPLIAPVSGASSLHKPVQPYLFTIRSSYRDEVDQAVRQLSSMGMKNLAAFASNDSFGSDALEGLRSAAKKYQLPDPVVATYERNTLAVQEAVKKIAAAKPQAVLLFCTAKPCDAFIRQYRQAGGFQTLFTLSNVSSPAFILGLGDAARGLGMTQVFPNPRNTTLPLMREFHAGVQGKIDGASYPAFEGYLAARLLVEGLRRAGPRPTRAALLAALEDVDGFDFGGFRLAFSASNHSGSRFVEVTVIGKDGMVMR